MGLSPAEAEAAGTYQQSFLRDDIEAVNPLAYIK